MGQVAGLVIKYLENLEGDMANPKFRNISTTNKLYRTKLAPFPAAAELLGTVGFKPDAASSGAFLMIR